MKLGRQVGVFKEPIELVPNVRFGSVAALHKSNSPTAAFGRIAVVRQHIFECRNLNVCFHLKRSFDQLDYCHFEGQLSARSRRSGTTCELYSTNPNQPLTPGSPADEEDGCSAWLVIFLLLTNHSIARYLRTVIGSVNNFEFGMSTLFPSESSSVYRRSIETTVPS